MKQNLKYPLFAYLLFLVFLCPASSWAQVNQDWGQIYSGTAKGMDEAHAIAADAAGNIYATGASVNSNGDLDIITLKYTPAGAILWKQIFNGTANEDDNGKAIAVDASGNCYVAGYATGKGTGEDIILIKYDAAGTLLWSQTYNGTADSSDEVAAIALDSEGNIYITGYASNKVTGTDVTTIKYDTAGNRQWIKTFNGTANGNDAARAIVIDNAGNAFITGYSVNTETFYDITTIKYSVKGEELWVATYNGKADDYDEANAITMDDKGNIYVAGFTDVSDKRNDLIVIAYKNTGEQLWLQTYSGKGNDDEARSVAFALGNICVTGHSTNKSGDFDILTICYSTLGDKLWLQTYNGDLKSDDEGIAITTDLQGACYITGYSNNIGLSEEIVTIKYDAKGIRQWIKLFNGTENFDDYPYAIINDGKGTIYVTGATNYDIINNTNDGDIVLIKYSQK